jgi:hypothetical protein
MRMLPLFAPISRRIWAAPDAMGNWTSCMRTPVRAIRRFRIRDRRCTSGTSSLSRDARKALRCSPETSQCSCLSRRRNWPEARQPRVEIGLSVEHSTADLLKLRAGSRGRVHGQRLH